MILILGRVCESNQISLKIINIFAVDCFQTFYWKQRTIDWVSQENIAHLVHLPLIYSLHTLRVTIVPLTQVPES